MLHKERLDYLVVSVDAFLALMPEEYQASEFHWVEQSTVSIPIYMAVSKASPCAELVEKIDQQLVNLVEQGVKL